MTDSDTSTETDSRNSGVLSDGDTIECDRCGDELGPLEPVTSIQFSGGVDAFRSVCHDCIQDIVRVWNEGDAVVGGDDGAE